MVVDFFCDPNRGILEFKDKFLDEEYKVRSILGEAISQNHPRLTSLTLSNCALSDDSIESFLHGLIGANTGGHQLAFLDLS